MIIILIRNQISNLFLLFSIVYSLAEEFLGQTQLANERRHMAQSIVDGMNKYLWSTQNDHYITQLVSSIVIDSHSLHH